MSSHIFISHATKDDEFVTQLRQALEGHGLTEWVDSRNLRGGDKLWPKIIAAIEQARQFIVVFGQSTFDSEWVFDELEKALEIEAQRNADGYRVIPIILPGFKTSALRRLAHFKDKEPLAIEIREGIGGLDEALPQILAALGERLPDDPQAAEVVTAPPVAELVLKLSDAKVETVDGKTRAKATAILIYEPADGARNIESNRFAFTAPLGPIETDDLRWYLEEYYRWPKGLFQERAARIEERLPTWGQDLYTAALASNAAQEPLSAWLHDATHFERRFSVMVDGDALEGASEDEQANTREAASLLLSLPWELLHDGRGFLFHGKHPVRVRRRLPNRHKQDEVKSTLPIRVLLVSPRPEDVSYIDHRISALPLVQAIEELGALVDLTILSPPTFAALETAISQQHFDVIHFDGHGVYDPCLGLGALCFEDPQDSTKHDNIDAQKLAAVIRDHRVPLVFLDACQSAQSELDPTTSVAAALLDEGVTSVVAMTHSVLVVTARRFVTAFYRELARGARVGTAMLAGQQALHSDSFRLQVMGAGALRLQDWFVPVLYQEKEDLRLVSKLPAAQVKQLQAKQRRRSFGKLIDQQERMQHAFVGRSRDLLKLERMLLGEKQDWRHRYVVVRGRGGEGKTTIAVELAHWLTRTNRFARAAFVSLEQYTDARGVLDEIGRQLLPDGWSVANFRDVKEALQPVERALRDRRTIIVLDNLESVIPAKDETTEDTERTEKKGIEDASDAQTVEERMEPETQENLRDLRALRGSLNEIFSLCRALLDADPATRIIFTSREPLPEPFHHRHRVAELRELEQNDAIELVAEVMKREGLEPKHDDAGNTPQEIAELVAAVGCHARALTLLARELARQGVRATTDNIHRLMAELERKHPGDRENSLYASVELSLRRLSPEMREQVKALGVFHDGAHIAVLQLVLEVEEETARQLAITLIEVGLAEDMGYGHLRLDPALPPYLLRELTDPTAVRTRWAAAMMQLTRFLYGQLAQNAELSARLTLMEQPNLLALLQWAAEQVAPEEVVDLAHSVESLIATLGRPQALAQATHVREQAAAKLGAWSHARFITESAQIDRWLEQGRLPEAFAAARQLLQHALAAGEEAFAAARYDIAEAHLKLGRVLRMGGEAEAALTPLKEAHQRYQVLADMGNAQAARMASLAITERANCLSDLGRVEESVVAYQEAIARAEKRDDLREVAVNNFQLGTVRVRQQRYVEALAAYEEARGLFERLGEPGSIAAAWHQTGMVYRYAGQFEQAERAYRQSLAIKVQQHNSAGEASSLTELGNLYEVMEQWEEAVKCHRRAAEIAVRLRDQMKEGLRRTNLANILIKLRRYDEARSELLRAIECNQPYGHTAAPWNTWNIIYNLERATGNAQAATQSRERARTLYLQYRRDGGENMNPTAQLYAAVAAALKDGVSESVSALAATLDKMLQVNADDPHAHALLPKLQAILRGVREAGLAEDEALNYDDAVELQLLLERLQP